MQRSLFTGFVVVLLAIADQVSAFGSSLPLYTNSQKVAQSDAVVTGKVTSIEKETVELPQFPGDKNKAAHTVAVIKVETNLAGAKNVTHIKVAFLPPIVEPPTQPGVIRTGGGGLPRVQFTEGQESLFFLQNHPGSDTYYTAQPAMAPIDAKAENYKDELAKAKQFADMIADPMKALKAEKLADRQSAAALILNKYRHNRGARMTEVAIPAEETKLILKVMLEADWTAADKPAPGFDYQISGPTIASWIGLQPGINGFPAIQVKAGESYNAKWKESVQSWLDKNGEKFEIKKFTTKK